MQYSDADRRGLPNYNWKKNKYDKDDDEDYYWDEKYSDEESRVQQVLQQAITSPLDLSDFREGPSKVHQCFSSSHRNSHTCINFTFTANNNINRSQG